ncbi:ExbD/TolR family protein [Leucothrix arctica]|uniref:Biopolymer transporter ExbD n=1 Tax=Leucothrix arctica TaxID=1481894 RepID=A0A317CAT2_9GAMM|nr:biopolymer transporter ExbD [Leucothrix arctica]PWQ95251.1 biopolymer transporter ExbD [Leucothrix arctica]
MNFTQHVPDEVEVNLTPLIDVVFLLLIFFMLTTTFDRNAKIKIDLPKTQSAVAVAEKNTMELMIDGGGNYYIDGREVLNKKSETLFQAMSQALDDRGSNPPLVISADANANYQSVITAMDIAGRLGLTNFSMATAQSQRK